MPENIAQTSKSKPDMERKTAVMQQHEIHPVLGETFAFEDLLPALDHLKTGGHIGKTLIGF